MFLRMPRVKQFSEEEALQKAMELFWKQGYHATSMQDLVSHLKINRASLYNSFPGGKEELFSKAFNLYRSSNRSAVMAFLNSQPSVKEGLRRLFGFAVDESVRDCDAKGCFVVNTTTELVPGDAAIAALLLQNKQDFEGIFLNFLQKGIETSEISPEKDLKAIAGLLFTLNNGLRVVAKVQADKESLMRVVDTALSVLEG